MKLLFVYQFCTNGGVEVVLRNRLEILNRQYPYIEIDILFFQDLGGKEIFSGFAEHIIICNDYGLIREHIGKNNYDFIITIDTPQIYAILSGTNHKIILEVHTAYADSRRYLRSVDGKSSKTIAIVVPSKSFRDLILKEMDKSIPVYVLPNFIGDSFRDQYEGLTIELVPPRKIIGWVGRLDGLKNWREFVEISSKLTKLRDDLEIFMIGGFRSPESEKQALFKELKKNHLLPSTRWLPFYNSMPLFYKYIAQSSGCFVSTSSNESFGMTVLEAMASKCPLVCSNIPSFCELLDDGKRGVIYNLGDIDMAVEKIDHLLNNPILRNRLTSNAYVAASDIYNPEKIIDEWVSLLEKLAKDS